MEGDYYSRVTKQIAEDRAGNGIYWLNGYCGIGALLALWFKQPILCAICIGIIVIVNLLKPFEESRRIDAALKQDAEYDKHHKR